MAHVCYVRPCLPTLPRFHHLAVELAVAQCAMGGMEIDFVKMV
jgi:hypothetical protein